MNFPKGSYWLLFCSLDLLPLTLITAVSTCPVRCFCTKQNDYRSLSRLGRGVGWGRGGVGRGGEGRQRHGVGPAPSPWVSFKPCALGLSSAPLAFPSSSWLGLAHPHPPNLSFLDRPLIVPPEVDSSITLTVITLLLYQNRLLWGVYEFSFSFLCTVLHPVPHI